jgi:hypothetical protein
MAMLANLPDGLYLLVLAATLSADMSHNQRRFNGLVIEKRHTCPRMAISLPFGGWEPHSVES